MLGFGEAKPKAAAGGWVKDTTEATFMQDVIEGSREVPVIVDFWAPWCGPCKTLGPALETAVNAAGGKVQMVKIDVDQNQRLCAMLSQQGLPLQSIPTVVGFFEGRPVDMFQGAVPGSEIKKFIERLIALGGDGGLADALAAAEQMLAEGAAADAAETFAAILEEQPGNAAAFGGLARSWMAAAELDKAEAFLNSASPELAKSKEVEAARAQLELARQAANAGPVTDLLAQVLHNPDDHQARFDLALALHAAGKIEAAVEELLELFRRDRDWNDAAAKAQLMIVFDALKPTDPIVLKGRRKLSSLIFA